VELLAGLILSLSAAVVGAWQITRRDRPIHGPIDDGTLGLPRLQRWDESYKPPRLQRLRSRFPRVELSRIAILTCLLIGLVAAGAVVYSRSISQHATETESFQRGVQSVAARHQEAMAASDTPTAWAMLIDARAQLDELLAKAPDDDARAPLELERTAITADIQGLSGAVTISGVRAIGSFPAPSDGVQPQVVANGGHVYLLSDGVYEIDPINAALVQLLKPDQQVDNEAVLPLRSLTVRDDQLLAVDAKRAYAFDASTGTWKSEKLATLDATGFTNITSSEAFDGNLYSLTPDSGQIMKFPAGAYDSQPEDWTGGLAKDNLKKAVDLAVDGNVYVLLADGSILDFFRSRLEATLTPQVVPPISRASAIVATADSPFIYVLHRPDGRIMILGHDGTLLQQVTTDENGPQIRNAEDLTIDSTNGIAYVATTDTIYTLRLPEAPVVPETETGTDTDSTGQPSDTETVTPSP
jgi:hypothetical protein